MNAAPYSITSAINAFIQALMPVKKTRYTKLTAMVATASSFHHYRRGRYNAWRNYQTVVTQYTQGTLAIDFIYTATNVLAWEGAADGRLRQNLNDFSQEQIDAVVAAVMAEFPTQPPQADTKE